MPKINPKLLKAACVAYDDNSCGVGIADDTGMWAAIEAYESAKAPAIDQPDGYEALRLEVRRLKARLEAIERKGDDE